MAGSIPTLSLEKLVVEAFTEDGKITAGNSSQVSDGTAAVLLVVRNDSAT